MNEKEEYIKTISFEIEFIEMTMDDMWVWMCQRTFHM